MGLKINQYIETVNQGNLNEFYVRIENLILDKNKKSLTVVVAAYSSPDDARISTPIYDDLVRPDFSGIIGVSIIYKGECIEYPVLVDVKMENRWDFNDLYSQGYSAVKKEFGKIFGEENISNEF